MSSKPTPKHSTPSPKPIPEVDVQATRAIPETLPPESLYAAHLPQLHPEGTLSPEPIELDPKLKKEEVKPTMSTEQPSSLQKIMSASVADIDAGEDVLFVSVNKDNRSPIMANGNEYSPFFTENKRALVYRVKAADADMFSNHEFVRHNKIVRV